MISASKITYSHDILKILRPKVKLNIINLLKKFCEFPPSTLTKPSRTLPNLTNSKDPNGSFKFKGAIQIISVKFSSLFGHPPPQCVLFLNTPPSLKLT